MYIDTIWQKLWNNEARNKLFETLPNLKERDQTRTKMVDNIAMLAMQIETLEENDEFLL